MCGPHRRAAAMGGMAGIRRRRRLEDPQRIRLARIGVVVRVTKGRQLTRSADEIVQHHTLNANYAGVEEATTKACTPTIRSLRRLVSRVSWGGRHRGRRASGKATCRRIHSYSEITEARILWLNFPLLASNSPSISIGPTSSSDFAAPRSSSSGSTGRSPASSSNRCPWWIPGAPGGAPAKTGIPVFPSSDGQQKDTLTIDWGRGLGL